MLENAYISMRKGLPSILIPWAFSSKTHRFENALESGSKRKLLHVLLVWRVESGRKRIKMKTMTKNIAGACVCSMCLEFYLRHNVQFYRFGTFWYGQSKTHQNGDVAANRSLCFQWRRPHIHLKVWTGPKAIPDHSLFSMLFHVIRWTIWRSL